MPRTDQTRRRWRTPRGSAWAIGIAGLLLAGAATVALTAATSAPRPIHPAPTHTVDGPAAPSTAVAEPVPVDARELARLPRATTFTTVAAAPRATRARPYGRMVHPSTTVPLFRGPGQAPLAALPARQLGSDTWLPVVDERPGWVQVLLPSRPNNSSGWLYLHDPRVTLARGDYRIVVDRARFSLTLHHHDSVVGRWRVGIGKPGSPTPTGTTFLLASIRDTAPTFSPIVLPLGAHSDTYTRYGGGPGTVAIHTWPRNSVYGTASSDGCVRVPRDALHTLATEVPIGTPVLIR